MIAVIVRPVLKSKVLLIKTQMKLSEIFDEPVLLYGSCIFVYRRKDDNKL